MSKAEVRSQKAEVRGQRSEDRGQRGRVRVRQKAYTFVDGERGGLRLRYLLHLPPGYWTEADHDAWTATYANPELYSWLFAQRRT